MVTESQPLQRDNGYFISEEVQHSFSWRNNLSFPSRTGTISLIFSSWRGNISPWRSNASLLAGYMHREGYSEKGLESCKPGRLLTAEAPALRGWLREE